MDNLGIVVEGVERETLKMMNEDMKKRWVEALRSGEYEQTRERLRGDDRHCCLGVLCDLVDPNRWEGEHWGETEVGDLPDEVMEAVGLSSPDPIVKTDSGEFCLTMCNDEKEMSFEEIADAIEASL